MRLVWCLVFVLVIAIAGCKPTGTGDESAILDITRTPTIETVDDERIQFSIDGLVISVTRPQAWEFYPTEYGIVIAETLDTVAQQGQINGLFTHVWVPPLGNFTLPAADRNRAALILNEIIHTPTYIGDATVSDPTPFDWDGVDAAYYLMRNEAGNLTVVVAIVPDGGTRLIAASISAPQDQSARLRAEIPALFGEFAVNNSTLSGQTLDAVLPASLEFPAAS